MTLPLRGRVVGLSDLTEADASAWSDLAARAAEPNPLFEPNCLLPARSLVNGDRINLVIAYSGDTMYGCFPVQIDDRWRSIRRPVVTNSQVRRMIYDGTPLLDKSRTTEAAGALLSAVREHSGSLPGIVVNDWVNDGGPVAAAMVEAAAGLGYATHRFNEWERPVIHRRADGDYRRHQGQNMRRNMRRYPRWLTRDFGEPVVAEDCTREPGIIERVLELEAAGYKGRERLAVATHPGEPEWFMEMCRRFDEEQRLHVFGLRLGERYIAFQLLLRGAAGLFGIKLMYDEQFSRYAPGVQLAFDAMELMFKTTDADWFDLCTYAGNETLLRLYPDRRPVMSLVTVTGGPLDRRFVEAVQVARRAKSLWRDTRARRQAEDVPA